MVEVYYLLGNRAKSLKNEEGCGYCARGMAVIGLGVTYTVS